MPTKLLRLMHAQSALDPDWRRFLFRRNLDATWIAALPSSMSVCVDYCGINRWTVWHVFNGYSAISCLTRRLCVGGCFATSDRFLRRMPMI